MIIHVHKGNSDSAFKLSRELGCKLMLREGSNYKGKLIINWGSSTMDPRFLLKPGVSIINPPDKVGLAINKVRALNIMHGADVSTVPFTSFRQKAITWSEEGHTVLARTKTHGKAGEGIEVCKPGDWPIPEARLYTQVVQRKTEYRIHVANGEVFAMCEKRKKNGVDADPIVWSHLKGWVFCIQNVNPPQYILDESIKAVKALGLDFGGVDIIDGKDGKPYVLEINTAPGIEGPTNLAKFANAFKRHYSAPHEG